MGRIEDEVAQLQQGVERPVVPQIPIDPLLDPSMQQIDPSQLSQEELQQLDAIGGKQAPQMPGPEGLGFNIQDLPLEAVSIGELCAALNFAEEYDMNEHADVLRNYIEGVVNKYVEKIEVSLFNS